MLARFTRMRVSALMVAFLAVAGAALVGGCEQQPGEGGDAPMTAPQQ